MRLIVSPGVRRDLRQLSHEVTERVATVMQTLAENPRPPGCLLLRNYHPPTWRIRVGDWRILYEIYDEEELVIITGVRHRSRAY